VRNVPLIPVVQCPWPWKQRRVHLKGPVPKVSASETSHGGPDLKCVGPPHGRPMPLDLGLQSEFVSQPQINDSMIKGKGKQMLQRSEANLTNLFVHNQIRNFSDSSYYPGHGDTTHILSHLDPKTDGFLKPSVDDHDVESDGGWNDDEHIVELAIKNPSRFSEVMANEVCL
jgi:hypothetical protein